MRRLEQDGKNDLIQNMTPRMVLDYLGIVTDGEKLADADFQFRLQLVTNAAGEPAVWQAGEAFQVQAEFAVHVYHGTILYYEGHTEESLPLIRIATAAFPAITAKNLETLLPFVETEHLEYLQQIHDAVVDLNQHSQFALIEPNRACQGNTAQRLCDRCVVKFFFQNLLTRENGYGILNVLHERYNT